jgi:uncharacterized repeat protein (TIGR01451 family)
MKKPTFSRLTYWFLSLLEIFFSAVTSFTNSVSSKWQNLKNVFFQNNSFLKQSRCTVVPLLFFFLCTISSYSQNYAPFVKQYDKQLKGDILTIGNNILNRSTTVSNEKPNNAYNGTDENGNFAMYYVNIDNGATSGIFSSSSAKLTIPNNIAPASPCYRVAYAALYWSAVFETPKGDAKRNDINKVKIKVPNTATSGYQNVTGTIIHDISDPANGVYESRSNSTQAYACFADITSLINATDPNGNYTVANVLATEGAKGTNGQTGLSAGWSIFIVYEDASLPTKAISSFNGFTARGSSSGELDTTISGFTTIPTGPVQARFAFAALEGDRTYRGDYLKINGTKITPTIRPLVSGSDNFFNSTINSLSTAFTDRVPNSTNTLGFDAGVLDIDPSSGIIKNGDTSAKITLGTNQDVYIYYFMAFSVEIIAPKIVLTKGVTKNGNPAEGTSVGLGDILSYEINYKNVGNDNAKTFTITDKLPDNTTFSFPSDITYMYGMPIPTTAAGNQYVTYDSTNRILTFKIPDLKYATNNAGSIRFKVAVVNDCSKLTNACSDKITNSAISRYIGDLGADPSNPAVYGEESFSSTSGCSAIPQSTNFLVGLDDCKNRRQEICTSSLTISASGGYASYSWSKSPTGSSPIGTGQTLVVTEPGVYYVKNTATPPCNDLQEIITVVGAGVRTNPILNYADNKVNGAVPVCTNDGEPLPKIFLCGTNASRLLDIGVTGATVIWEKTSCARPSTLSDLCANRSTSCDWVPAGPNGSQFTADTTGYYRVTINSGGCVNTYYFDVYKVDQTYTETHKDILCNNKGNITLGLLSGYEYSLTNVGTNSTSGYQDSNSFDIWNAGTYIVNYRLKNVTGTCVYKTAQIDIRKLDLTPKVENPNEQPLCFNDKGIFTVSATLGFSGYYFDLYDDNGLITPIGPITDRFYTFNNLTPGKNYHVEVYTKDGGSKVCSSSVYKYINNPSSEIILSSQVVKPLTTCNDGQYKIAATGGSGSGYSFFVDGSTTAQPSSLNGNTDNNAIILLTPTAKDYSIRVVDSKLCEKTIVVKVPNNTKPTYVINSTSASCYGSGSEIKIENVVANGYSMSYSINNGGSFVTNPTFSNLISGTYNVVVRYGITYTPQYGSPTTIYCQDPAVQKIITGPTATVTASAGVGELAGCGPLQGTEPTGLLRFTNVQGGTAPYEYSFDGGNTWGSVSQKYVPKGDYTLAVRDALLCTYIIPYTVKLDAKPGDPVIDDNLNTVYNCDGTATATVVVNTPSVPPGGASYTYEYYLQLNKTGALVPNTPLDNNVFTNVPVGNHNVIIKYKVNTVSSYSNLLQEDFGKGGFTTTPGINPAYCFEDEATTHLDPAYKCNKDQWINDGEYAVASKIRTVFSTWMVANDHTLPDDPLGRFLCVNVGGSAGIGGILYSKPIKDVIQNQPVIISLWAENLIKSIHPTLHDPKLTIELVNNLNGIGGTETIVASSDPSAGHTNPWQIPKSDKWEYKELSLNPGTYSNLSFVIRSYSNEFNGNDVLIDDIWVRQIPKSCGNEITRPVEIKADGAFDSSIISHSNLKCVGDSSGTITFETKNFGSGYEYKVDGGSFIPTSAASVVVSGLTAALILLLFEIILLVLVRKL